MMQRILLGLFLLVPCFCSAIVPAMGKIPIKGLQVDLTDPSYQNGELKTTEGGIIRAKELFLQAKKISYIHRDTAGVEEHKFIAEGNLFFRFKDQIYIGDRLEFDLNTQSGVIYNVITQSGPWFLEGKKLILHPDGSSDIYNCIVNMSEGQENDWSIRSPEVTISKNATLRAKNVRFFVMRKPVFWVPSITKELRDTSKNPIKYRFRYFGKQGPRVGLSYTFKTGSNWKNRLLFDISLTRGFGGGFETEYKNPLNDFERFFTFNYYAYDMKTDESEKRHRYRFQGKYLNRYIHDIDFRATYDVLSDSSFTSDFTSKGLDSARAGATEAELTKKEQDWLSSLNAKVRVNDFQTVKQQLPLFQYSRRPMELGESGLILDNRVTAGYLDYLYASQTPDVTNFNSTRASLYQRLYRGFSSEYGSVTPYIGYQAIGYGNSPSNDAKALAQGIVGFECHSRFVRDDARIRQILEPYLQYDFSSMPQVSPGSHYIFDLRDGLYKQNMLRFGGRNYLRFLKDDGFLSQFDFDLYARAFFDTPTIPRKIPRVYFDANFKPTPYTFYTLSSAYDTKRNNLDHLNARADITVSENIAFSLEYRHRNSYSWRKVDPDNFMLDSFRPEQDLLHSQLSDRRDTFLTHIFVRPLPNHAFEFITRHGWRRSDKPSYNEYEINWIMKIREVFHITLNFQSEKLKIVGESTFPLEQRRRPGISSLQRSAKETTTWYRSVMTLQSVPADCLYLVMNLLPLKDKNSVARLSRTFLAASSNHPMWQHLCRESGIVVKPTELCRRKFLIQLKSGCPIARFALGMLSHQGIWVAKDLARVMDSCENLFSWTPPLLENLFTWTPPLLESVFGKSEHTRKVEELQKKAGRLWLEIFYFDNVPREIKTFKQQNRIRQRIIFSQKPYDRMGPCILCDIKDGFVSVSSNTSAASLKVVATSSDLSRREKAIATIFWARACGYSIDPDLDRALEGIKNDDTLTFFLKDNARIFLEYRLEHQFSHLSLKE